MSLKRLAIAATDLPWVRSRCGCCSYMNSLTCNGMPFQLLEFNTRLQKGKGHSMRRKFRNILIAIFHHPVNSSHVSLRTAHQRLPSPFAVR